MNELRDEAIKLGRAGFRLLPLKPRDKTPHIHGGCTNATSNHDDIAEWWTEHPQDNIGIACGYGLIVIDLDVHPERGEDGEETLHDWESEHGELPETVTAETGSGGKHIYYRVTDNISNSTNADLGIDIRAEGGYVVAPPSIHPSGNLYTWENSPDETEVAQADENVLAFIRYIQGDKKKKDFSEKFELPEVIKEGERNDTLFRYACSLQSKGNSDAEVLALVGLANKRCIEPVKDDELRSIVSQAINYEKGTAQKIIKPKPFQTVALVTNKNGFPKQTISNCVQVLKEDTKLKDHFFFDVFANVVNVIFPLPWSDTKETRPIADVDEINLTVYMEQKYDLGNQPKIRDAILSVAMENKKNPLKEKLDSLSWDGQERMDTLLTVFLGAVPNDYVVEATRVFLYGAIARAYSAGTYKSVKFDYVPIFVGRQGIGKSKFLSMLSMEQSYFCESLNSFSGKDSFSVIQGKWIVEIAELSAIKQAKAVEEIKAFLTKELDTYRLPYAHNATDFYRTCVFAGTTNNSSFLTDPTGNRRFLPIECGVLEPSKSLWDDDTKSYIEQTWAEAVHKWKTEKPSLVLSSQARNYAQEKQEAYMEDDPRIGVIQEYLDNKLERVIVAQKAGEQIRPIDYRVCVKEIINEALDDYDTKKNQNALQNDVHEIMQNKIIGWTYSEDRKRCKNYGVQRHYIPSSVAFLDQ